MSCRMLPLLFIPLLFILPSCVCGPFVVNVTQSSYQAEENHNVTLEWTFTTNPERPSEALGVRCVLLTYERPIHLLYVHDGVQIPEFQDEHFAGRVQWDQDVLRGRVRLHVSRLRTSDSGRYLCDVFTSYGENSGRCRLDVSAVRDRPETNGPDGGRDSSGTESRPQTESRGRIVLYCGLATVYLVLLFLLPLFFSGLIRIPIKIFYFEKGPDTPVCTSEPRSGV